MLSEHRSFAEESARILVDVAKKHEATLEEYRMGQSLYAEAKAAFDGWIDQLVFEIQAGNQNQPSHQYETLETRAIATGDKFTLFVKELFLRGYSRRGRTGDLVVSFFEKLKDGGRAVLNGLKDTSGPEQERVIAQLKGYKWPPFETFERAQ